DGQVGERRNAVARDDALRAPEGSAHRVTPMAIVTAPLKLVTVLPIASCAVTCTAGLITEPALVFDGWIVNASCVTATATRKSALVLSPNETHGPPRPV